jgi:hypothetical protein
MHREITIFCKLSSYASALWIFFSFKITISIVNFLLKCYDVYIKNVLLFCKFIFSLYSRKILNLYICTQIVENSSVEWQKVENNMKLNCILVIFITLYISKLKISFYENSIKHLKFTKILVLLNMLPKKWPGKHSISWSKINKKL